MKVKYNLIIYVLLLCVSDTSLILLFFFTQGFTYIAPSLLDSLGTSSSHDHALGAHYRSEEIEKPMDEEDNFHKTIMQKKQKLDSRVHKSTSTIIQSDLSDSKRPTDQFQRGVNIN